MRKPKRRHSGQNRSLALLACCLAAAFAVSSGACGTQSAPQADFEPAAETGAAAEAGAETESAAETGTYEGRDAEFDHQATGFPIRGAHVFVDCESCHVRGLFEGTPIHCEGCHTRSGQVAAPGMPLDHIPTTARCNECHSERTWLGARFVHTPQVLGVCFSCHNNRNQVGKTPDHIPSPETCNDCHSIRTWKLF